MLAHIDADAFFASVLQRKHPELRGKPLLALGMGGGCVIAASYEAKAKGVKTGIPYREAIRLCPQALSVPSDFRETGLASKQIESILEGHCPVIEQMSIDEWFLDLRTLVGGLPKDLCMWATAIQQEILRMTTLSVSVGVAPTKLLAKMASEYRKPGGVTVVINDLCGEGGLCPPGAAPYREKRAHEGKAVGLSLMLRDRPAAAIPGIGRRRAIDTDTRGWKTAWDIASADLEEISGMFGKNGRDMQRELRGEVISNVSTDPAPPKSVSRCRSFQATEDRDSVWAYCLQHLSYLTLKMRRHHLACRGVSAWVRDRQYRYWSAHVTSTHPLDTEESVLPLLQRCFSDLKRSATTYTQAGVGLWRLSPEGTEQFSLFREPLETVRASDLQLSLDRIRDRFGRDIIGRGSAISVGEQQRPSIGPSIIE